MLKKVTSFATVALAAVTLAACGNNANNTSSDKASDQTVWEKVQKEGTLKVATPGTYQPTSFYNDDNELVGYEVDMMKEVGERIGVKVEFVETGFDQAFTSLDGGRVDVTLNNFDITEQRQEKYNVSEPYKYGVGGMIVRGDGSSEMSAADLSDWAGKKAGGASGTEFMKIAEKQGAELVTYDNVTGDVYLNDVANGRTDFIPNDYAAQKLFVEYMLKENPDLNVKMSDVQYNPTEQGIFMSKADDSLKKKIDGAIQEMKKDGTLKKLSEMYYAGQDLTVPFANADKLPVIDTSDVK